MPCQLWAMGWDGGHLHEFVFGDINYGMSDPDLPSDPPTLNEARVSLGRALGALKSFTDIYDYSDNWLVDVRCLGETGVLASIVRRPSRGQSRLAAARHATHRALHRSAMPVGLWSSRNASMPPSSSRAFRL